MSHLSKLAALAFLLLGATFLPATGWHSGPEEVLAQLESRELPEFVRGLRVPSPLTVSGLSIDSLMRNPAPGLVAPPGPRQVVIRLKTGPVASLGDPRLADRQVTDRQRTERLARRSRIELEQRRFLDRMLQVDPKARVLGRTQLVLNALLAEVDSAAIKALSRDPAVSRISPVTNYELALSETVPYIGAPPVHDLGVDGAGVRVAVLDTGIDYTHAELGGPGTVTGYRAAYGAAPADRRNTTTDGLFPTTKVVGGFDFVGEVWPAGPLAPDPDPIDFDGHGTHVADIIAGRKGVAPGASLYAVKVCSAVAGGCSGVALIQAMEFAVDPNGDGDPADHVDIVNLSLGADYGQPFDDDLSTAVDNATRLGVLSVAASGNGGDRPYITASPAAAATAIAVAQTQVPSAFLPSISVIEPEVSRGRYQAVFQPWSVQPDGIIQGPVRYGDGAGGNLDGCAPFAGGAQEGRIVVVDRGSCFFSDKIRYIQEAGGIMGIIARVASGPPFPGGFGGGGPITIPAYMIARTDGDLLRAGNAVVRIDPEEGISLVGAVVDTSSRGPEFQSNRVKPELAAPGASVSAEPGTGTGTTPFGGTSGATPMIAGAAALLMQSARDKLDARQVPVGSKGAGRLSPLEVKARLMNTAEVDIRDRDDGRLAPITRIGGGEARVDRAVAAPAAVWEDGESSAALSFGFIDVAGRTAALTKRVRLRNYSGRSLRYRLTPTFRYADDAATGAVSFSLPDTVSVGGGEDTVFEVTLNIDGARLRNNLMNSGPLGNDPGPLGINEYDGYLVLDDGAHPIHLPWHALPRQAARVMPAGARQVLGDGLFSTAALTNTIELRNTGVGMAQNQAYSLLTLSPARQRGGRGEQAPTPDLRAIGWNTFTAPAGFCSADPSYVMVFAVNTWGRQTHANWPGIFWFDLDTDQDGTVDFSVFNGDAGLLSGTGEGRNMTWVMDRATGEATSLFFTEHATNTANTGLYICGDQIGGAPPYQDINAVAFALDIYFGGPGDVVEGLTFAPFGEGYLAPELPDIEGGTSELVTVIGRDTFARRSGVKSSEGAGLLVFTNSDRGASSRGGATPDTEALIFAPPGGRESASPQRLKADTESDETGPSPLFRRGSH